MITKSIEEILITGILVYISIIVLVLFCGMCCIPISKPTNNNKSLTHSGEMKDE